MRLSFRLGRGNVDRSLRKGVETETRQTVDLLVNELRQRTPRASGRAARSWRKTRDNQGYTIENPVPYADRLDRGWSKQAPRGITQPAITELRKRGRLQ